MLVCPSCKRLLKVRYGARRAPACFHDCLRRCDACRVGYSNALEDPAIIWEDPCQNLPEEMRSGALDAVALAANVHNRNSKRFRFGFSTSEDAVTWVIFGWLGRQGQDFLADNLARNLGLVPGTKPKVLLWGAPLGNDLTARPLSQGLQKVSTRLGERPSFRSEPDIILDFGDAGLAVIEVKVNSGNISKTKRRKFGRYVRSEAFADPKGTIDGGGYQLARNWRIGWKLAAGRPFRLVNLSKTRECQRQKFEDCLAQTPSARFQHLRWQDFFRIAKNPNQWPEWMIAWLDHPHRLKKETENAQTPHS